jgi:uncharacterized protein
LHRARFLFSEAQRGLARFLAGARCFVDLGCGALEGQAEALQQGLPVARSGRQDESPGRRHGFVLTEIFEDDTIRPRMSHRPVIDGLEFARTGSRLEGQCPVADFPRLRDALHSPAGVLRYEVEGIAEERGKPALRLKLAGSLQVVCQRCLGSLEFPFRIETSLQLAASQAEMDAGPLDAEGPEQIVAGREMQVLDLVEDELLLALPIAPRHEGCARGAAETAGARHTPFAGLRGLMGGTKH